MGGCCGRQTPACCCVNVCSSYQANNTGKKKVSMTRRGNKIMAAKQPANSKVVERFATPEGTYNVKLPDEKFVAINSSVFLATGDVVLSDLINKRLKLYTCNFDIITFIEFPMAAIQLAASQNLPLIYVAFPDRIRQIHVDGSSLKRSGFIKTPGVCRGMAINKFDGKAISLNMDNDKGQVNLLTPGGNLQLEVAEDQEGGRIFVRPEQIAVTRDLVTVVADRASHHVVGVGHDGSVMFRYTGVRNPSAITCDEMNYIYVAGQNSIHQLTSQGQLVKLFISKAEIGFSPMSMSYNPRTRMLLLTGRGHKVKLFKLINMLVPEAS